MPDRIIQCMIDTLDAKGYGIKRIGEVVEMYNRRKNFAVSNGRSVADAALIAEQETLIEMAFRAQAKAHVLRSNMAKINDVKLRVGGAADAKQISQAGISLWEDNPRFAGKNVNTLTRNYLGKYWSIMSSVLDDFSKGAFGRQLGKAHFPDVVRELFGQTTGNKVAKEIATAYKAVQKVMIADFNKAGGILRELVDFNLPQAQSATKMLKKAGTYVDAQKAWVDAHMGWLDWNKMRWPDGTVIAQADRQRMLENVFDTIASNGKSDIDVKLGGGQGASVGNMLDKHRFLVYKDADSWMAAHDAYSEGSVFDVITRHIESMAHKTALVDVWGSNPAMMVQAARQAMQKRAAEVAKTGSAKFKSTAAIVNLKRFDNVSDSGLHINTMNPESRIAAGINTTSNLATAAMLKAATLLAFGGDTFNALAVRFAQNQSFINYMGGYLKAMFPGGYRKQAELLTQAGFVVDELISNNFIAARFGNGQMYGKAFSQRAADFTMRASWMTRHTNAARGANQLEMMGALARFRDQPLDKVPFNVIMKRAGISEAEWDAVRKNVALWEPNGAKFIRPLDILDMKHGSKDAIYQKFQSMIVDESYRMVLSSTMEARATLTGGLRPDTTAGAIVHSFSMFKNYPVTMLNSYTRLFQSLEGKARGKFLAALVVGTVVNGALGLQMRNISSGKELQDMTDPKFMLRALIAGGGLSIWGDFVTGAMSGDPGDIAATLGGPLAQELADVWAAVGGSVFQWAGLSDRVSEFDGQKAGSKAVELLKRYVVPGFWQANLVIERDVWDNLQEWIDPAGKRRSDRARVSRQKRVYGNDYYLPPGQGVFTGP